MGSQEAYHQRWRNLMPELAGAGVQLITSAPAVVFAVAATRNPGILTAMARELGGRGGLFVAGLITLAPPIAGIFTGDWARDRCQGRLEL